MKTKLIIPAFFLIKAAIQLNAIIVVDPALSLTDGNDTVILTTEGEGVANGAPITFNHIDAEGGFDRLELTLTGSEIFSGRYYGFEETNITSGNALIETSVFESSIITVSSSGAIGGQGSITGSLTLQAGARFVFNTSSTLNVSGSVSFDESFGIDDLDGMNNSILLGRYTIISGTPTDFSTLNIENFGASNAFDLGSGKSAYFDQGSLEVVVVPESSNYAPIFVMFSLVFAVGRRMRIRGTKV